MFLYSVFIREPLINFEKSSIIDVRPDPQETAELVTFTEEILNGNFIFCAVNTLLYIDQIKSRIP